MRRLVLGLCLGAGATLLAASSSVYTTYGTGNGTAQAFVQLCPKSDGTQNAVPCSSASAGSVTQGAGSNSNPWTTQGPTLTWQGNLTVAAATSTAFSSTTINDGTLPTTAAALTYLLAINQGTNSVTVCFQGGTCTATTGVIIPAGGFKSNPLPGTALPSFYSTSGTIVSLSNG